MSEVKKTFQRFTVFEQIEHLVLIISFTTLAVTGLPQKYFESPISVAVIRALGGIEVIRIIHHTAAAIFLVEAVYHLIAVGYKLLVQNKKATMLPGIKDGTDAIQWFGYNLGIVKKFPKMPRYNFMEKAEYWALLWGLIVMGLTGLMLWNPIHTTEFLPGEFIPAAKAAHGGEAVLAVLAIILWHFYNVHIKHWNWSMIKGTITRHEMEEEHGEELEQIESGRLPMPPAPAVARQRAFIFAPAAAVVTVALLFVTYYFLTFEKTSITTLPPAERAAVYVRATATPGPTQTSLPSATPKPKDGVVATATVPAPSMGSITWDSGIQAMLAMNCSACHGSAGGFSADTYANVMKVVSPGDPSGSTIYTVQKAGGHPGQLNAEDLATLEQWIQAGAPESASGASAAQPAEQPTATVSAGSDGASSSSLTWNTGIKATFEGTCGTCHSEGASMGGFVAVTYDGVLQQLQKGDPSASKIVEVQQAGGHPGTFSPEELDQVINWIKAGAPEQ